MKDAHGHGSNSRGAAGALPPGTRVNKTMGVRQSGMIVKPFPFEKANDGSYGGVRPGQVPVQWDDGTQGYIHPQHIEAAGGGTPSQTIAAQHGIDTSHLSTPVDGNYGTRYNRDAVNNAIASSNRAGRRIGGREASMIHRLLKGRQVGDS